MSVKNKSIEQKMSDLRELAAWFESEDFTLEQAAEKFKQAAALAKEVEADLSTLKNDISVLKQSFEESA